jgi:hypothetical protein
MDEIKEYQGLIMMEPISLKGDYETKMIWLNGKELNPKYSQKIYNHSAEGFDWSNTVDGSAQLALAILLELTQNKRISMILHHLFKNDCVSTLPKCDFEINFDFGEWKNKHTNKNYIFLKK